MEDKILDFLNRSGMFIPSERYDSYVCFLTGMDFCNETGFLKSFERWLCESKGLPNNLAFSRSVLYYNRDATPVREDVLDNGEREEQAISVLKELLIEYIKINDDSLL